MYPYACLRRLLHWAFALCLLLTGVAHAEISPYLQTPTATSIWVSWKTASGTETRIEVGTSQDQLTKVVTGTTQTLASNYLYHSAQITGLQPDTFYYYRARTGTETSPVYRFRTQPVVGANNGHIRFLVMGDNQIIADNRYEKLVRAAKAKLESLYRQPVEASVNLVVNVGDQVDVGTLEQYEKVHFKMSAPISGNLPIMTTVGNHEFYYDGGLALYGAHFHYNGIAYKGIQPAANESYYANQVGRVLFIHLNSMSTDAAQETWLRNVTAAADADNTVDWVVSLLHHPYQAEQYVGDISQKFRDSWMAILAASKKHVLNIGGHHHLYARGQTRDWPIYHMISWRHGLGSVLGPVARRRLRRRAEDHRELGLADRRHRRRQPHDEGRDVRRSASDRLRHRGLQLSQQAHRQLRPASSMAPRRASRRCRTPVASIVTLPYTFNSSSVRHWFGRDAEQHAVPDRDGHEFPEPRGRQDPRLREHLRRHGCAALRAGEHPQERQHSQLDGAGLRPAERQLLRPRAPSRQQRRVVVVVGFEVVHRHRQHQRRAGDQHREADVCADRSSRRDVCERLRQAEGLDRHLQEGSDAGQWPALDPIQVCQRPQRHGELHRPAAEPGIFRGLLHG